MTPRRDWARGFILAVGIGWIVLTAAGIYYARLKAIPAALAAPLIAAFLLEYAFYIVPGFPRLREWLADRFPPRQLALGFALSALAPYLLYSLATGSFRPVPAARLAALVLVLSFWYVLRRPSRAGDLALLGLIAAALVTKFFRQIYLSPISSEDIDILGKLMLFRLVVTVMLVLRGAEHTGFGFVPTPREWKIGFRNFFWFLPIGVALFAGLGLLRVETSWMEVATAPVVFLGFLWVVALFEEFVARGLLQQWLSDWTGHPMIALLTASCMFGFFHLWFRGFPNWRIAIMAAVLGCFCGKSYNEAGGIRAAMVTHALIVTAWRTILS